MSYDMFAMRIPDGDGNPRVGAYEAVVRELARHGFELPDDGWIDLTTSDGGLADSNFGADRDARFTSIGYHVRSFTLELAALIYTTAKAAGMFLVETGGGPFYLLTDERQINELPKDESLNWQPLMIKSGGDLYDFCTEGYEKWKEFRDFALSRKQGDEGYSGGGPDAT